jgi:hypothetical protein
MLDAIDKRNFFLSLSAVHGQHIAHYAGFSVPSEDVQKSEVLDIINKWLILSGSGINSHIKQCVDWTLEVAQDSSKNPDEAEQTRDVFIAYSAALLSHLLDKGLIELAPNLSMQEEYTTDFIRDMFRIVVEDSDE